MESSRHPSSVMRRGLLLLGSLVTLSLFFTAFARFVRGFRAPAAPSPERQPSPESNTAFSPPRYAVERELGGEDGISQKSAVKPFRWTLYLPVLLIVALSLFFLKNALPDTGSWLFLGLAGASLLFGIEAST